MITLDAPLLKLQAVLAGAVTTSHLTYHVAFLDVMPAHPLPTLRRGLKRGFTNNTTDVDICEASGRDAGSRDIEHITIFNADTVAATVTVKSDDGTTEVFYIKKTLAAGEALCYEHGGAGWYVV